MEVRGVAAMWVQHRIQETNGYSNRSIAACTAVAVVAFGLLLWLTGSFSWTTATGVAASAALAVTL